MEPINARLVDELAWLSRLSLPEEERRAMTAQLKRIVDYMDILGRLDPAGIEPLSHEAPVGNVLRPDVVEPSLDRGELLANAPAQDGEMFLTPRSVE